MADNKDINSMLTELDRKCVSTGDLFNKMRDSLLNNSSENISREGLDKLFVSINNAEHAYVQIEEALEEADISIDQFYKLNPIGVDRYNDMAQFRSFMWKMIAVGYRSLVVGG